MQKVRDGKQKKGNLFFFVFWFKQDRKNLYPSRSSARENLHTHYLLFFSILR